MQPDAPIKKMRDAIVEITFIVRRGKIVVTRYAVNLEKNVAETLAAFLIKNVAATAVVQPAQSVAGKSVANQGKVAAERVTVVLPDMFAVQINAVAQGKNVVDLLVALN